MQSLSPQLERTSMDGREVPKSRQGQRIMECLIQGADGERVATPSWLSSREQRSGGLRPEHRPGRPCSKLEPGRFEESSEPCRPVAARGAKPRRMRQEGSHQLSIALATSKFFSMAACPAA